MVWRSVITLLLISAPLSLCCNDEDIISQNLNAGFVTADFDNAGFVTADFEVLKCNDKDIISQNPNCKADFGVLKDICVMTSEELNNNLEALFCVQVHPLAVQTVSDQCQHHLWEVKLEITKQDKFLSYAKDICTVDEDLDLIEKCYRGNKKRPGSFSACMLSKQGPRVPPVHDVGCDQFISRIETLIFSDYPFLADLVQKCNASITKLKCGRVRMGPRDRNSQGRTIACLSEKFEDVEDDCKYEIVRIAELQTGVQERDGRVYECLVRYKMEKEMSEDCRQLLTRRQKLAARDYKVDRQITMEKPQGKELNSTSEKSLNELVAETQMAREWKPDPVLKDACEEVVMTSCNPKSGNVAVMSCLMKEMRKQGGVMNNYCRSVLLQLHYFLARKVLLDENLYTKCKADATRLCGAQEGWQNQDKDPRHKLVFSCLVRNIYNDEDLDCVDEVERVIQKRAVSVHLHPKVEHYCRDTLHQVCIAHIGPGEEIQCLQDNMETVSSECEKAIVEHTMLEARNPYFNPIPVQDCGNVAM